MNVSFRSIYPFHFYFGMHNAVVAATAAGGGYGDLFTFMDLLTTNSRRCANSFKHLRIQSTTIELVTAENEKH